jgi:hypothetical protein
VHRTRLVMDSYHGLVTSAFEQRWMGGGGVCVDWGIRGVKRASEMTSRLRLISWDDDGYSKSLQQGLNEEWSLARECG